MSLSFPCFASNQINSGHIVSLLNFVPRCFRNKIEKDCILGKGHSTRLGHTL